MADLIKRQTVITQLNEKVSATHYDVALPETRADIVQETFGSTVANWAASTAYKVGDIVSYNGSTHECKVAHTSTSTFNSANWEARLRRRFVTPADETNWSGGGVALKYRGVWSSASTYAFRDVVHLTSSGMKEYFIAIAASTNKVPNVETDTSYWVNLNLWATNAKNANFVKVLKNDTGTTEHYLTFVDSSNASPGNLEQLYTDTQLKYVPSENKLYTLAEFADKYKRTFSNSRSATPIGAGDVSLDDEFEKVYENIETLYEGSGHTLTLQKNGATVGTYDPSADSTIDITIASTDVTDWTDAVKTTGGTAFVRYDTPQTLTAPQQAQARTNIDAQIAGDYAHLVNGKVPSEELPDWILGQMDFGGTALLGTDNGKVESGQEFFNGKTLAKVLTANITPWVASTSYVANQFVTYNGIIYRFNASYSGSTFNYGVVNALPTKVYFNENNKGAFSAATAYQVGNIVLYNGIHYLFHTAHPVGAWNAAHAVPIWNSLIAQQINGTYFIVKANPASTGTIVEESVSVGDWILSNGDMNWSIIKNTDAVTMVNGQIGAVETYKGAWSNATAYFMGDWVKYDSVLYLATATTGNTNKVPSAADSTFWQVAGRLYTASDAIKLDGTVFKHDVTRTNTTTTSPTVAANGGTFTVRNETLDAWGHSINTAVQNITLSQTWREIKVAGTQVIAATDNTALDLIKSTDDMVNPVAVGKTVRFDHKSNYATKTTTTDVAVLDSGTVAFNVAGNDKYGHVNAQLSQSITNIVNMDGPQTITGSKTFNNHILTGVDNTYDIGTSEKKFRNIYATNFNGNLIGGADKWTTAREFQINVQSGLKANGTSNISGTATQSVDGSSNYTWTITLGESGVGDNWGVGVESATYSAVQVNKRGVVVAGAQSIEFGHTVGEGPSTGLVVGGLFFRRVTAPAL